MVMHGNENVIIKFVGGIDYWERVTYLVGMSDANCGSHTLYKDMCMYTQTRRKPRKRTARQSDQLFFTYLVWGVNVAIILGMITAVIFS